jgi:hypothetical protein
LNTPSFRKRKTVWMMPSDPDALSRPQDDSYFHQVWIVMARAENYIGQMVD